LFERLCIFVVTAIDDNFLHWFKNNETILSLV
jgi:hypothetical protein